MTTERKVDRRIQRTRALLREALMQLIIDKGYDEITIQDIADTANVARTTFYLHFKDKDDLLFSTMRDIYESLMEAAIPPRVENFPSMREEDCIPEDFLHVEEYADFYRIMFGERGSAAFLARVRQYLAEEVILDTLQERIPPDYDLKIPLDVMSWAIAGAHIAVMKWWLDHDMVHSPQKMSFMLQQFLAPGILYALGWDIPSDTSESAEKADD